MRLLIVGSGGREHALAWQLAQGATSCNLHAAPGNPGIASLGTCHPIQPTDITALVALAEELAIDLTVVGPEAPLAEGIADAFHARGLRLFGPTRAAAQLESSKIFAKHLLHRHAIPTAEFETFDDPAQALAHIRRIARPMVVKADGLAAGKGVVVAADEAEAEQAVADFMVRKIHGPAGARIIVEERLSGREASILAFVSGRRVTPLRPAQDFKRAHDGDQGPNTGGMGSFAPAPVSPSELGFVVDEILEPVAAAMVDEGRPYTGVLYAGLMLTADGPRVLEFNCRFGDPEAQVILPLLDGDLGAALIDVLEERSPELTWRDEYAACVVIASGGYPGPHRTGMPIHGLAAVPEDVLIFHAGTRGVGEAILTSGGRVLNVVGRGPTLDAAVGRAYAGVSRINFEGMQCRTDIGKDVGRTSKVEDRPDQLASVSAGAKS